MNASSKPQRSAHSVWAELARELEKNADSMSDAIALFADRPRASELADLRVQVQGIARGAALVTQARAWSRPTAGRPSALSEIRGLQWRLVMAVAGLEIILKSLIGRAHPGIEEFRILERRIGNSDVESMPCPEVSPSHRRRWLEDESILRFLSLRGADLGIISGWLASEDRRPLEGMANQLALAKALRNCTAHAALSATKCQQLNLRPAMNQLPTVIQIATARIFEVLCEELS